MKRLSCLSWMNAYVTFFSSGIFMEEVHDNVSYSNPVFPLRLEPGSSQIFMYSISTIVTSDNSVLSDLISNYIPFMPWDVKVQECTQTAWNLIKSIEYEQTEMQQWNSIRQSEMRCHWACPYASLCRLLKSRPNFRSRPSQKILLSHFPLLVLSPPVSDFILSSFLVLLFVFLIDVRRMSWLITCAGPCQETSCSNWPSEENTRMYRENMKRNRSEPVCRVLVCRFCQK
jgi:hypothetical protein